MARIKDTDVVAVRERSRIDEVVREVVTLKNAGGGSLKGLCPFHEERSPSFHVTPAKGFWHCFGCQEGGDVIDFARKIDHLTFAEAVEKLALRYGVELHYEEGGAAPNRNKGQRTRLVEAHKAAADYFAENMTTPEAEIGRAFLKERGFDREAAQHFGLGFAPNGWDGLTGQLRKLGFTDDELVTGGLAARGSRGPYDRFRGRLMWPIRDLSGDVVGFGARRLRADDDGPKYLNTPETPLYKKSQVLYGVDLARKEISRKQQAVIVEGYTDVMAAHLAGVGTAVATCGTAFGGEHVKILRRLLMDQDEFRGEVIFTFDGDAAGRKAAIRAFGEDQKFVSQTFVAIEPSGLDPCDLRMQQGDEAVRELVGRRRPLFEYVIRAALEDFDLDTAEGRVAGLRAAAPVIAQIRDRALQPEYIRTVAGWLGMESSAVAQSVRSITKTAPAKEHGGSSATSRSVESRVDVTTNSGSASEWQRPDERDTANQIERESLKCVMQLPGQTASWYASVEASAYTWQIHKLIHQAVSAAGGPTAAPDDRAWIEAVLASAGDDAIRSYVRELALEPLRHEADSDDENEQWREYAEAVIARLLEMDATRRTMELKGRLQRTNPVDQKTEYDKMFAELLELEKYRRSLREHAMGEA